MRSPVAALILAVLTIVALATQAVASEGEASSKDGKPGAPGTNIDMPFLMAPLTGRDGKLSGYAYVSSRLTASSDISANEARDKIAFIQDAFVRDVNKTEIATTGDPATVDNSALEIRLLTDARRIVGAAKIRSIAITQVQIAPLRPSPVTPAAAAQQNGSTPETPAKPTKPP
jgi:hypothetical protein